MLKEWGREETPRKCVMPRRQLVGALDVRGFLLGFI
jgi:hypothetical protein